MLAAMTSLALLYTSASFAQETGTINAIQVVSTGTSSNDGILVTGNFSPATGCPTNGFLILSSDDYYTAIYAALLSAQAQGSTIQWQFVYCITTSPFTGYARANGYTVVTP